jgi:chemotaxis protein CheX
MHREIYRQLDDAVAEIFAVMLNLACVPAPASDAPALLEPWLLASVSFSGTLDGICILSLDEPAAAELTANLTGIPPDQLASELYADTAGELCNMIAGSWKTRQFNERAACHLSCPTITLGSPLLPSSGRHSGFQKEVTRAYLVPGQSLILHLAFD